ncbi:MAG: hypothetical protein B7Z55_13940 [Planctomycetales bacterium 12-60-4]|nr:MAG: hypothetical protein B7Z55_13940 [Planctomycetales bacterium 12-60-4]
MRIDLSKTALLMGSLLWSTLAVPGRAADETDLGIVRVVAAPPGKGTAQFTATHLGQGLLLTCGHCCRYSGGPQSPVTVQILSLRDRRPYRTTPGRVTCYDNKVDVGFIQLDDPKALTTAYELAPADFATPLGTGVLQYGWSQELVQLQSVRTVITSVNLFDGPANLETRDHPHPGDSGAPLVDLKTGKVIGVTTGVDAWDRFGVHCGIAPIHELMVRCGVTLPMIQQAAGTMP